MPESVPHNTAARHLELVLADWAAHVDRTVFVARNLAVRWVEQAPQIGIDPDVCLLEPSPPGASDLGSLCTWKPGHAVPPLCFEIVSKNHPHKDYSGIQDRYASLGVRELVVFDPLLAGPASLGGPVLLQIWRRDDLGVLERVHFSDEPGYSRVLEAWLVPRERRLDIADDRKGERLWLTAEGRLAKERETALAEKERAETERERAETERERAETERERERTARIALEARVAELELKSKGGGER